MCICVTAKSDPCEKKYCKNNANCLEDKYSPDGTKCECLNYCKPNYAPVLGRKTVLTKTTISFSSGHLNLTFFLLNCFQPPTMRRTAMNARCDSSRATRPKIGSSSRAAVPVRPPTEDHLPQLLLPPHHRLLLCHPHQDETQLLTTALPTRPRHPQVAAAAATVTAIEAAPATVDLRARRTLPRPLLPLPPLHCPFRPIRRIEITTTTTC